MQDAARVCGVTRLALVGGLYAMPCSTISTKILAGLPDLDLVVEGSAEGLAHCLLHRCGPERVSELRVHGGYGTVELMLDEVLVGRSS